VSSITTLGESSKWRATRNPIPPMTAHVTGVVDGMIGRVTYQAVDKLQISVLL
jgi:hypothetical protein